MNDQTPVILTDLRIPFVRLVFFLVKVAVAAIPAAIIIGTVLIVLTTIVVAAMGGNPANVLRRWRYFILRV